MDKKWYDNLLLIADFMPSEPESFDKSDAEAQVKAIERLGFNTQHIEVNDITNGEAGISYFKTEHCFVQKSDHLKTYCRSYKESGNNAIIYFNIHWLAESLSSIKPEWCQTDRDGNKVKEGSCIRIFGPGLYGSLQRQQNCLKHRQAVNL